MTTSAESAPSAEASQDLKGKALLLISSAAPTKRFIYQRLKALGVRIILLSPEETWASRYADTLITADTLNHAECLSRVEEALKDIPLEGALTFWEEAVPLCAALCEKFGWHGHSLQAALNARNKLLTRKSLEAAGLGKFSPAWGQVKNLKELDAQAKKIGFPLVLKPAWGERSQFVVRLDGIEEAKNAFEYLKDNMTPRFDHIYTYGTEVIAEAYVTGAEIDVDMLVQDGEVRFHAFTDNFPTKEPFFVETGDAMPSRHEDADLEAVLRMAKDAVKALGLKNGALHVEAKIAETGPILIEVNARMGGDYIHDWIKTVWGVDIIEEAARIALGLDCRPKRLKAPAVIWWALPGASPAWSAAWWPPRRKTPPRSTT